MLSGAPGAGSAELDRDAVAVLLAVFGSGVVLETVTMFGTLPLPLSLARIVTVACAPFASVPIVQVTVRLPDA